MATPAGFEPATPGLGIRCSILLSYGARYALPLPSRCRIVKRGAGRRRGGRRRQVEAGEAVSAILVITGLEREAAILRRALARAPRAVAARVVIACAGPGPRAALAAMRRAQDEAARRGPAAELCLSAGFAAALIPALEPGTAVLPAEIVARDGRWPARAAGALAAALPALPVARLAEAAAPLTTPAAKTRLHLKTGAVAADMESAALARACADRGIAFAALRVISDAQAHRLPRAVIAAVDDAGRLSPGRLSAGLLARPSDWGAFAGLARAGLRAEAALGRLGAALFEVALPGLL
ncbi:MAG: hypothetical protein KatS3mg119_0250 [Rhodothalassiaceae bacterium]|nr:MAG: hypothetical protein KatS3mg119_0250 [Rhodothalassiaceae bacterium]